MRKILLYILCLTVSSITCAQVGIRNLNPISAFHIDGIGNTSSSPTASELTDDIIIQTDGAGGIGVGIGKIPRASAQLDLQSTTKGFTLNKVALNSPTDITTVASPSVGMMTYNTNTSANITEGVFFHDGIRWLRVDTNTALPELTVSTLLSNTVTTGIAHADITSGKYDGTLLKFTSTGTIKVPSTSAYAFCIRLYGIVPAFTNTSPAVVHYYIYLVKKSNLTILDSAELDVITYSGKEQAYLVTLGASLAQNDEVYIYLAHHTSHAYATWTLYGASTTTANKSSLVYWKI